MDYAAVSQAVRRFENEIKRDKMVYETEKTMAKALENRRKVEC